MSKRHIIYIGFVLIIICAISMFITGRKNTIKVPVSGEDESINLEDLEIHVENATVAIIKDVRIIDNSVLIDISANNPGTTFLKVKKKGEEDTLTYIPIYVHETGIMTYGTLYGNCRGDIVVPIAITLYLILIFSRLFVTFRKSMKENMYQYRNILLLGVMLFLTFALCYSAAGVFRYRGLIQTLHMLMGSVTFFAKLMLPVTVIISLLVAISNAKLIKNEGRNIKNVMGTVMGLLLCALSVAPELISNYLYFHNTTIDIHNEQGIPMYVFMFVEALVYVIVVYLECILIATIIIAIKAARHVPAFDKDYILILGCKIKKDGTLTKLLQGRADRAVEFAKLQKDKTGKDIIFVPSGGKGNDEVMSEGEAIKNYLISVGIDEKHIMAETESENTFQNFGKSKALIDKAENEDSKIAFSTTNYHVFRSGMYATKQDIKAEGIGSKTKSYFWINAFVREFIATLESEKLIHFLLVMGISLVVLIMVALIYLSNVS